MWKKQLIKVWCDQSLSMEAQCWALVEMAVKDELENVQKCAARFVTINYSYETGSITGILDDLKWETPQKRRKDNRLILLYKGLKGKARILTDDLIPKNRRCRNQHSIVFQIPSASKDAYKKSIFPQTIRDLILSSHRLNCWMIAYLNSLPLWELETNLPRLSPDEVCHFAFSPVYYFDSEQN